jgi:hypothetical protein
LWERGQLAAAVAATGAHRQTGQVVTDRVELSPTARVFLHASMRRDRIRRGRAVTVLSVLLVLALGAVGIVVTQQRAVEHQRDLALSRQVAGQALELRDTNPALAAQLSLAAYQLAPTPEARGSLFNIVGHPYATRLTRHTSAVRSVGFSLDGHTLATASVDKTAELWDVHDPHHPAILSILTDHTRAVNSVAFSLDGHFLATGSNDQTAQLWDIRDPHHPHLLGIVSGHKGIINSVAFSPDGQTLATGSGDQTARLWDIRDPHHPTTLATLTDHTNEVNSVAFSPDGQNLATASDDDTAQLWDIHDPTTPVR